MRRANLLGHAAAPRVLQQPDWNARPDNACFAAADVGAGFDAEKRIAKVLTESLGDLNLLPRKQFAQTSSIVAQSAKLAVSGLGGSHTALGEVSSLVPTSGHLGRVDF